MNISIITPHYNDFDGLCHLYQCLTKQTLPTWEWVIVDDFSDVEVLQVIKKWHHDLADNKVILICSATKTNASVCRNKGAYTAKYDNMVFLDADDLISYDFVKNRQVKVIDFLVYGNYFHLESSGKEIYTAKKNALYLDYFLAARFIWQTSCVLWNKNYFFSIGGFQETLPRLQDIELNVRALQNSMRYEVLDNIADFYYRVKPIRERTNFVKPVCEAVYLFISEFLVTQNLSVHQQSLLTGYYYLCTKYLERSNSTKDLTFVSRNLKLFYKKDYIKTYKYAFGFIVLKGFSFGLLSGHQFLRINRYLFKPKYI